MFAVIKTGGKQYKVNVGDCIRTEKLDVNRGETVEFNEVLAVSNDNELITDKQKLENIKVIGKVVEQDRAKKIIVLKFKRRKSYRRKRGHRQYYTGVCIQEITGLA